MKQTIKALPYACEHHEGQYRRGKNKIPYIYHPLLVACHVRALGFDNDSLIAASLLHDVCENCGVSEEELPVNDETKIATIVKLLDRLLCIIKFMYTNLI